MSSSLSPESTGKSANTESPSQPASRQGGESPTAPSLTSPAEHQAPASVHVSSETRTRLFATPVSISVPVYSPPENNPVLTMVRNFLSPCSRHYSDDRETVTLTEAYALSKIGAHHFEYDSNLNRLILRADSTFRQRGLEEGVPKVVMDWLMGNPAEDKLVLPAEELVTTKEAPEGLFDERFMALE